MGDVVEVEVDRMATGGEGVGRLTDGRVIFIRGALGGELVRAEVVEEKRRFVRGRAIEVLRPSIHRRVAGCPHASSQCGGCDWMHLEPTGQQTAKESIVVEQLQRLGGIKNPAVNSVFQARGLRTTVRCAVVDGRAGYRGRRSDVAFAASSCQAAHPSVEELIIDGRFGDAVEVTLRVGAATGERLAIVDCDPGTVHLPPDVQVAHRDAIDGVAIHERVAGRLWRVSARSFFQTSLIGAEQLVVSVQGALSDSGGDVVDLYAGVGLLGGACAPDRLTVAVESSPASAADARHNLGDHVRVDAVRVERWQPVTAGVVIADPARSGLARGGVDTLNATEASRLVLVSCDPASLGRDAALLVAAGWRLQGCEIIDMFPDTSRIEVVSRFDR